MSAIVSAGQSPAGRRQQGPVLPVPERRGSAVAKPESQWYRLDSAGILYSALQREEYSAIYRFSAVMAAPVGMTLVWSV